MLDVGFAQHLPGQIFREKFIFVRHETPNITAVKALPSKQIVYNILPHPSCQRGGLMHHCRVDLLARLRKTCQPVVPGLEVMRKLPISKQAVRLRRLGNFPIGLI